MLLPGRIRMTQVGGRVWCTPCVLYRNWSIRMRAKLSVGAVFMASLLVSGCGGMTRVNKEYVVDPTLIEPGRSAPESKREKLYDPDVGWTKYALIERGEGPPIA